MSCESETSRNLSKYEQLKFFKPQYEPQHNFSMDNDEKRFYFISSILTVLSFG